MKKTTPILLMLSLSLTSLAFTGNAHAAGSNTIALGNSFSLEVKDTALFNSAVEKIGESGSFLANGQKLSWGPMMSAPQGEFCEIRSSKTFSAGDSVQMKIIHTDSGASSSKPGTFDIYFAANSADDSVLLNCAILQDPDNYFMPVSDINKSLGNAGSVTVLLNN